MTQKHTQGPWGLDNNATLEKAASEWTIGPLLGRRIIAIVRTNAADARAIAAAPELLAFAQNVGSIGEEQLAAMDISLARDYIRTIKALAADAIAKAEGR